MKSLDSPVNRCETVSLPVLLYQHTKLVRLQVDCSVYVLYVIITYNTYTSLLMSLRHWRLEKATEHRTTQLAFSDLIRKCVQRSERTGKMKLTKGVAVE